MYSGNFSGQYNRLFRELAAAYMAGNDVASLGDRARLFALANTAMADAFICSWNSKKKFNFWRPIHAIQNGDQDGNILTEKDATWTPYFLPITPNYPDYTSGANNITGAMHARSSCSSEAIGRSPPFPYLRARRRRAASPEAGDSPITYERSSRT